METKKYNEVINTIERGGYSSSLSNANYTMGGSDPGIVGDDGMYEDVASAIIDAAGVYDVLTLDDDYDFFVACRKVGVNYASCVYDYGNNLLVAYDCDVRDMTIGELCRYINTAVETTGLLSVDSYSELAELAEESCRDKVILDVIDDTIHNNGWQDHRGNDDCYICSDGTRTLKIDADNDRVILIPVNEE